MEFILQNYGFFIFLGSIILSVGGVFFAIKNHEDRISKIESKTENLDTLKNDIQWIKEILSDIKKKLDDVSNCPR